MALEKIVVLGTGGTIAGVAPDPQDSRHYQAARLGVDALLGDVPRPAGCAVLVEQVAQVDSKDMDRAVWQAMLQRCRHWLAQPDVRGLVLTHGTDTLEETAWLLHAVLAPERPLVLTCAMRPANAPDADGPANLRDALAVAAWPGACGVLAVCAGQVHGAADVQKVHTSRLDAFSSGDAPLRAEVDAAGVHLRAGWPQEGQPWPASMFDALPDLPAWPRVEIVTSHALADGALVDLLLDADAAHRLGLSPLRGLVVAGTGNGTVHRALEAALQRAAAAGVVVVRASRCGAGVVTSRPGDAFAVLPGLSPAKARVALMLLLLQADLRGDGVEPL